MILFHSKKKEMNTLIIILVKPTSSNYLRVFTKFSMHVSEFKDLNLMQEAYLLFKGLVH